MARLELMRPSWVLLRWLGLLALIWMGVWLGERLAGAKETRHVSFSGRVTNNPPRSRPRHEVPVTPPGFPFGPRTGSADPANPGGTQGFGFLFHP
jgi:hypothetical protein